MMSSRTLKMMSMAKTAEQKVNNNIRSRSSNNHSDGTSMEEQELTIIIASGKPDTSSPWKENTGSMETSVSESESEYLPSTDTEHECTNELFNEETNSENVSQLELSNLSELESGYSNEESSMRLSVAKENDVRGKQRKQTKQQKLKQQSKHLENSTIEEIYISVPSALKNETGGRIRDKTHICYFCHKKLKQLAIHFEVMHKNELEVSKLIALPKKCKARRDGFANLLRIGDYYHNSEVLIKKHGDLVLVRRPTENESKFFTYSDYGPCPDCLGFLLRKHLWHHLKFGCPLRKETGEKKAMQRKPKFESMALIAHTFNNLLSNEFSVNILAKLKDDEISLICRQDLLVMKFGDLLFEKYRTTQSELIRQSMRQLARLVIELRKLDTSKTWLSQWLVPQCFDLITLAVKNICVVKYRHTDRPQFGVPSLALKVGHSLRKCIAVQRGLSLRKGDLESNNSLNSFLNIMDLEWNYKISSNALSTMHNKKMNATELLPLTDDLKKLNDFLNNQLIISKREFLKVKNYQNWVRFGSILLTKIILFNKRRSGEASRITLEQYSSRPDWSQTGTEEFKNTLSPLERELAVRLTIVQIRGKRGRNVSVLLVEEVKKCLDILIKYRNNVGISIENQYVFARGGGSIEHIRGHDCLRNLCNEAELHRQDLITGTALRKYVATVCQIFNLTENESDWLARHLGHDIRVHRDFYRLHDSSIELTKVSRLLMAVESGEANKFKGKKLNEINICDLPDLDNNEKSDNEDGEDNEDSEDNEEYFEDISIGTTIKGTTKRKSKRIPKRKTKKLKNKNDSEESEQEPIDEFSDDELPKITKSKPRKKLVTQKKKTKVRPWSSEESEAVITFFTSLIKKLTVPGKAKCDECKERYSDVLSSRSWRDIKYHVKNYITKLKRCK